MRAKQKANGPGTRGARLGKGDLEHVRTKEFMLARPLWIQMTDSLTMVVLWGIDFQTLICVVGFECGIWRAVHARGLFRGCICW